MDNLGDRPWSAMSLTVAEGRPLSERPRAEGILGNSDVWPIQGCQQGLGVARESECGHPTDSGLSPRSDTETARNGGFCPRWSVHSTRLRRTGVARMLSRNAKSGRLVKSKVRTTAGKRAVVKRATARVRTKRAGAASRALPS
jgi:hypothetical protein